MSLMKAGRINNFPEKFEFVEFPEAGTVVKFQLNVARSHEFKGESGEFHMLLPRTYTFPVQSQTIDPVSKQTIPIAVITSKDKDDIPSFHKIQFNPSANNGIFAVTIGDVLSNDIYQYLMLSSFREREEGDKTAVPNTQALYRLVDDKKAATAKIKEIDAKYEAYTIAKGLGDDELREKVLSLGGDFNSDIDQMRAFLLNYADSNPTAFMAIANNEDTKYKALIKTALDLGAITLNGNKVILTKGNAEIFEMRTDEPLALGDEFVYFVKTSEVGQPMLTAIKKEVDSISKKKKIAESK